MLRHIGTKALVGVFLLTPAFAQTAAPAFDVESLKLDTSHDQPMGDYNNGRVVIHNQSLRSFIGAAYHVPNDHIVGPGWLDSVHLDLAAKTDASTSEDESRLMLRTLLAEKLALKVHSETRTQPIYALKVAKNGPKFPESKGDPYAWSGCPSYHPIQCPNANMAALVTALNQVARSQLDLPDKDMTDLKGRYDIRLSLEPDLGGQAPSVFYAVEDQLGLKLEAEKLRSSPSKRS